MMRAALRWLLAAVCALLLTLLLVAAVAAQDGIIHVVQPGDTVGKLAWRYGVRSMEIVAANNLANPNRIYVGQSLLIPVSGTVGTWLPAEVAGSAACPCEALVIASPAPGITVTSPFTVTGLAAASAPSLVVAVLDGSAQEIGRAYGFAKVGSGKYAPFAIPVTFTVPANSQPGRVQVWSMSPRDGAIEHLNSVAVRVQGMELDPLLAQLQVATTARNPATLSSLMTDSFDVVVYGSRSLDLPLSKAEALRQLEVNALVAGAPRLDFSVDARALLGDRVALDPNVVHVVYSTGWGPEQRDDAFLLISEVDGRAQFSGMIYVPEALIDYR
jgi:LysM repeat protein